MNYEQKYYDALERARDLMTNQNPPAFDKHLIETVFPELQESEDERMKKAIIHILYENYTDAAVIEGVEIAEIVTWLEKQGKRPTNKIKPKFKVGDFITNGYCLGKVIEITNDAYLLDTGQGIPFSCENTHLWTINDAKDGDVLMPAKTNCPFIYRKTDNNNNLAYYYAGVDGNGNFSEGCLKNTMYHFGSVAGITPAPKEQRDLLFAKMKEAGYEWDTEKKELKKIEVSEDDERIRKAIISCCLDHGSKYKYLDVSMEEMCTWLEKQ